MSTWIDIPAGSDFGIDNLPIGVVSTARRGGRRRVATRIGDSVLPLGDVFVGATFSHVFEQATANAFVALGASRWAEVRERLHAFVTDRRRARPLAHVDDVGVHLPVAVGDFVDFYSSLDHAARVGRLFRPDSDPVLANWRHLPVGYHGRAGTIAVSGTPVRRPSGLIATDGDVDRHPSGRLDYEAEIGFIIGVGNKPGEAIAPDDADAHVYGAVLINDWSARDIQSFEYQPLGPFLGKSFMTSMSPWIVPLAALEAFRVPAVEQDPTPDQSLVGEARCAFDVTVAARIGDSEVGRASMAHLYWTHDQQLAHLTSNGATTRPGDLFATGTISGPGDGECGCLLEATSAGSEPVTLADGTSRSWLADGDTVTVSATAGRAGSGVGFGECVGTVVAGAER